MRLKTNEFGAYFAEFPVEYCIDFMSLIPDPVIMPRLGITIKEKELGIDVEKE